MFCRDLPCLACSWDWYGSVLGNGCQPIQKQRTEDIRRYFQQPIVGVEREAYIKVRGDLPRQLPFESTLRFTGPVPVNY